MMTEMKKDSKDISEQELKLREVVSQIGDLDEEAMKKAWERQDSLAKPPRSLGRLEEIGAQLAGITGKVHNSAKNGCIIIMSADNGVVEEGVSSAPQSVTLAQTINFTRGLTGVAALAKHFGTDLMVVDVGVNADINCPEVIDRKIRKGTDNLAKTHAMSREEAVQAILTGVERAIAASEAGYDILGVGEMGIGNTTTSSAVLSALTGRPVEETVGKGGGITDESFRRKKEVIQNALKEYRPDPEDPIDVLAKVGGFDIAAMAGVYIGAALCRLPIVIDGFISIVAALTATRLNPLAKKFMLPSHSSYEQGYNHAIAALGLEPILLLGMRLGEGSGCPLAFQVIDGACAIMNEMGTFAEAEINDEYLDEIREGDKFSVDGM